MKEKKIICEWLCDIVTALKTFAQLLKEFVNTVLDEDAESEE